MQVVCSCFLMVFLGCLAWIVGGFYLDFLCPGCGLKLAMASMLVVKLCRPVCGVWFWWFCIGLMPLSLF